MKKYYNTVLFSLTLFTAIGYSGEWHESFQNFSIESGDSITSMASSEFDFGRVFAVGSNGNVYRSFSGGKHWENTISFSEPLTDVEFLSNGEGERVLVAGNNGFVAYTDDMGNSWV